MPIGPEVVTPDEVDVSDLALTTELNGLVMQSARTSQMLVDVPSTVEFFSSFTTLRPGDVIATGTPAGVGFARNPPVWLQPDDVIEITIEGVGTIRNRVVAEDGDRSGWRWRPGAPPAASAESPPVLPGRPHSGRTVTRRGDDQCRPPGEHKGQKTRLTARRPARRRPRRLLRRRAGGLQQQRPAAAAAPAATAGRRLGLALVVADLARSAGRRRARPDLPGLLRRRHPGHQQRRRRARPQAHLQGRGHPG